MKKLSVLALIVASAVAISLLSGCGDTNATSQSQSQSGGSTPYDLMALDGTGHALPTAQDGGKTWFVGLIDQPLHFGPTSRGGLDPGETGLRISTPGSDIAPEYDYDRTDPRVVQFHQAGKVLVELLIGLDNGNHAVMASCWLRIDAGSSNGPGSKYVVSFEQYMDHVWKPWFQYGLWSGCAVRVNITRDGAPVRYLAIRINEPGGQTLTVVPPSSGFEYVLPMAGQYRFTVIIPGEPDPPWIDAIAVDSI